MISVKDAAMDVIHLSPEWPDFTGLDGARSLGRGWIAAVHADDRQVVHATLDACARERRGYTLEYRLMHRGGTAVWVSDGAVASSAPEGGRFLGLIGSISDVADDGRRTRAWGRIGEFAPPPPLPSTLSGARQDLLADYLLLARSLAGQNGDPAIVQAVDMALYLTRRHLTRQIH